MAEILRKSLENHDAQFPKLVFYWPTINISSLLHSKMLKMEFRFSINY